MGGDWGEGGGISLNALYLTLLNLQLQNKYFPKKKIMQNNINTEFKSFSQNQYLK